MPAADAFPATRWSLIAALPGSPGLAGALVGIYADAVAGYLRMRLRHLPVQRQDDIVQDVLLQLMTKPEVLAKAQPGLDSRFRHYLMHLAWLEACNAQRRLRPTGGGDATDLPTEDAPDTMDRAWAVSLVQEALNDLPTRLEADAWQVLRRTLIDGIPLRSAAAELGLPLATAHRRLARARLVLQGVLAERLRAAGELGASEDADAACSVLLAAAARG